MPDFRIVIDVREVAGGDIDELANEIMQEHGDTYDADRGDFTVVVQQKVGDTFFGRVEGDDVIAG